MLKTCYTGAPIVRSIADLVQPGELFPGAWVITRINVPKDDRGHGHGRMLLEAICRDADEEGVRLAVEPRPYGDGGLDYDKLVAWYERYGFKMHRTGYMVRKVGAHASPSPHGL